MCIQVWQEVPFDSFTISINLSSMSVSVNGVNLNNIRYADDTVLVATTEKDLQSLLDVVNEKGQKFKMGMNVRKTKVLVISRDQSKRVNLQLNKLNVSQVK